MAENSDELLERCLAGDQDAWAVLFCRYDNVMRMVLGKDIDQSAADEICARAWMAILRNDCRLLCKFDPARGKLSTFFGAVAKSERRNYFRGERRRKTRQRIAARLENSSDPLSLPRSEFLALLSPAERRFFVGRMVGKGLTRANAWQLKHRVRKKLVEYLWG